jgi:putative redox protein
MEITIKHYNKQTLFEAKNGNGISFIIGNSINNNVNHVRPMELLLTSLASCSSIDIIQILNKQKETIFDYEVRVKATRDKTKTPSLFKNITMYYIFKGDLKETKIRKAIELSLNKYCSVSKIIEQTATINYVIILNGIQYVN